MPGTLPRPAVDAEGAIRAWLRTTTAAGPNGYTIGARWYFGAPDPVVFPLGIVQPPSSVVPVPGGVVPAYQATGQLDLWGATARDRYNLGALATALEGEIAGMPSGTPMGGAAVGLGAEVVSGHRWAPDPTDGKARLIIVARFDMRPV